jgi:hypothetical protein
MDAALLQALFTAISDLNLNTHGVVITAEIDDSPEGLLLQLVEEFVLKAIL